MRLAALDVGYRGDKGLVAAWVFQDWEAEEGYGLGRVLWGVAPYESGQFYKRELPCLLWLLERAGAFDVLLVDGYVDLGEGPGLGRHLYEALSRETVVIGVAKRPHAGALAVPVCRGASRVPLWVSAAGMELEEAAARVKGMAGPHRIPFALKQADRISREVTWAAPL